MKSLIFTGVIKYFSLATLKSILVIFLPNQNVSFKRSLLLFSPIIPTNKTGK